MCYIYSIEILYLKYKNLSVCIIVRYNYIITRNIFILFDLIIILKIMASSSCVTCDASNIMILFASIMFSLTYEEKYVRSVRPFSRHVTDDRYGVGDPPRSSLVLEKTSPRDNPEHHHGPPVETRKTAGCCQPSSYRFPFFASLS